MVELSLITVTWAVPAFPLRNGHFPRQLFITRATIIWKKFIQGLSLARISIRVVVVLLCRGS